MNRTAWTLALWLLALATACSESETIPATQVVVSVGSELSDLAVVRAAIFDEAGVEAGNSWDFPVRDYPLPFSFTVFPASRGTTGFRVVLTALDAAGQELVQTKANVKFAPKKTLGVELWLREACRGKLCEPNESCTEASPGLGSCQPIPAVEGSVITPGDELGGSNDDAGSMDASDGQDDGSMSDGGAADAAAPEDASNDTGPAQDAATCAPACGANAECLLDGAAPRCECLQGYQLKNGACTCAPGTPCDTIDCGAPPAVANAETILTGGTRYGQKVVYSCTTGFTPGGERQCGSDGTWSLPAPTCNEVTCPMLFAPTNGSVSAPALTYGKMATYSCKADYLLSATSTRTCKADGKWTDPEPTCAPSFTSVTPAPFSYCALRVDSSVACWGQSLKGTPNSQSEVMLGPTAIQGTSGTTQVSVGRFFACTRRSYGDAFCWGQNDMGQLGNGSMVGSNTIVPVTGLQTSVMEIASASNHTCVRMFDGTARCWGANSYGQLGDGSSTLRNTPVQVAGLTNVAQVSAAETYTCFRLADSTVSCTGSSPVGSTLMPAPVAGLTNVTAIAAGYDFLCAIKSDASVVCMGSNGNGQLGNASTTSSTTPVTAMGLTNVTQISALYHTACARKTDGTVACWGYNENGQVGNGGRVDVGTPTTVPGLTNVTSVAASTRATCAAKTDGTVVCWGDNNVAQLGLGTLQVPSTLTPRTVAVPPN